MSDGRDTESSGAAAQNAFPTQLSEMIDKVLANPQIISSVASALSASQKETESATDQTQSVSASGAVEASAPSDASLNAISDKLPEIMSMLGPVMSSASTAQKIGGGDKKEALLCAVRPYLSGGRREAIDYIIKLSKISEILKKMS